VSDGELVCIRIAVAREPVDLRAPGIPEPEQPRALVERLAGCIVERRPHDAKAGAVLHVEQQRVPAAREQAQERRVERFGLQVERGDVAVEMVDGDERQAAPPGDSLRRGEPYEQRTDQARSLRDRDALDVRERDAGAIERLADDRRDELEVAPRGDLRDDPAEGRVQLRLGGDRVRENLALGRDDRGRRLVA